jgi:hypothetical protein
VRADFSRRDFPCSCVRSSVTRSWRPSVQLVSSLGSRSFFHESSTGAGISRSCFFCSRVKLVSSAGCFPHFLPPMCAGRPGTGFQDSVFHPWLPVRPVVSLSATPGLSPKIDFWPGVCAPDLSSCDFWPRVCAPDVLLSARQSVLVTLLRVDFLLRSVPC